MIMLEYLFKKLICFPVALVMWVLILALPIYLLFIHPLYYFLTNRDWAEDAESLFSYSVEN